MKIAIVANATWNIYNFRQNIIRKLIDEGHDVIVMAPIDKYISYHEEYHNLEHIPLRKLKRDSVNPLRDMQLTAELTRLYRKHKPDLIIHYTVKPNIYGTIAARMAGIPSIAVVTGLGYSFLHNGLVNRTTTMLYKWTSRFQSKLVFENSDDFELFVAEKLVDRNKCVAVSGCGVDTEYFKPNGEYRSGSDNETVFSFIGRLLYDKGLKEFIDAAHLVHEQNKNARFWIFGEIDRDNPSAIKERDLVSWVKDDVITYHGAKDDIRKYIELSDCVVLPSYREGMSRVLMEAMSMERPVITTDTPGCRQTVIEGKNGLLVPVRDAGSLAEAMQRFLDTPAQERQRMGEAGRELAVRIFDEKIVASQIYTIISDVLQEIESK